MGRYGISSVDLSSVRHSIRSRLEMNNVPPDLAERALNQCADLMRDLQRVHQLAAEVGLKLSEFRHEYNLAFYCDAEYGGRRIASISKGWDDPGIALGEIIEIHARNMPLF